MRPSGNENKSREFQATTNQGGLRIDQRFAKM
jgi:hypothetical protein